MTLKLAEGAATALSTYLSTNFGARVTALNAEYADGITLITPATFAISEVLEADSFPIIETICLNTGIQGIAGDYIGSVHNLSVICTVMDDTDAGEAKPNLRKRVYRYARAIVELCRAAQAAGGFSDGAGATYQIQLPRELISFSQVARLRGRAQSIAACAVRVDLQIQEAG